jgi:FtsK/SpoIIIE family
VPDALTLWSFAVLVIGGLMYAAMHMSSRSASAPTHTAAVRRPGWIARRRARGGITHRRGCVGVGYRSAVGAVHLTERELAGHGLVVGGPGSGKTTFLQLLVEASAGRVPVVIVRACRSTSG